MLLRKCAGGCGRETYQVVGRRMEKCDACMSEEEVQEYLDRYLDTIRPSKAMLLLTLM